MSCACVILESVNGQSPGDFVPVASFYTDDPNPEVGDTMDFYDTSTNAPTSWVWTVNGSLVSNNQNFTNFYVNSQNPPLVVQLTATNFAGSNSYSQTYYPSLP
jgi:PKD repeat protein